MKTCSKCGTNENLTEHHVHPVCFFKRKRNGLKIIICRKCHDKLEANILAVESFIGNVAYGTRYKLYRESYEKILNNFVHSTKINYVSR